MFPKLFSTYKSFLKPWTTKGPDDWRCFKLVDGKIVPPHSCEINAVDHCNLGCTDCNHASPAAVPRIAEPDIVLRDLSLLFKSYKADTLKIIGGEPLLHPDLLSLIRAVRESGICNNIVLVTNGTLLHQMDGDIWDALDEVELSVYPVTRKLLDLNMSTILQNAEKHKVRLSTYLYKYFQIAFSLVGTTDVSLIRRIYKTCLRAHIWGCQSIYEGYFFKCPQCIYIPKILNQSVAYDYRKDGIKINCASDFQDILKNYLMSKEPLFACRYCLGNVGKIRTNTMPITSEWTSIHRVPTEQLVDYNKLGFLEISETIYDMSNIRVQYEDAERSCG
ncbi:MAG TPA: 4Fe-4S cluster-binding domain-containing protein [Smithella sp.]|nr:4Fe-4S cluster-binding domain-containing protein [Smithella sp.]